MAARQISVKEIASHNKATDTWIVVDNKVYDITEFAPEHPGGAEIIQRYAGRDASSAYNAIHAPSVIITGLPPTKHLGDLDISTIDSTWTLPPPTASKALNLDGGRPPLDTLINAHDFEDVASRTLTPKAWAFFSSAATDLVTRDANRSMFSRIWFRPRVMVDVCEIDISATMQGIPMTLPLFVSPSALARLVHTEGEKELARGAAAKGVPQGISTNASFGISEIIGAAPSHDYFFQLYVNKNRKVSEGLLAEAKKLGVKGVMVTVDAAMAGKREADERARADESLKSPMTGLTATNDKKGGGLGRIMGTHIDPKLNWEDVAWLRNNTDLPLILKGVQTAADARLAMEHGLEGIILSNHGGRNLDTSPPAILVLLELQKNCPEVFSALEVYVDGGIRRGTDILKCLCLGATAVGLGRPFLFSLMYGQEGVGHLVDLLREELTTAMALVGITSLEQCHPDLVNTGDVDHLIPNGMSHPYAKTPRKSRPSRVAKAKL